MAAFLAAQAGAQQTTAPTTKPHPAQTTRRGQVLFHGSDDGSQAAEGEEARPVAQEAGRRDRPVTPAATIAAITDTQRSAVRIASWDLDLHVAPKSSRLSARARLTVTNAGTEPLHKLTLQLSSTLEWEAVRSTQPLAFTQHLLDTDTDHTGQVREALITLPTPLAPGASLSLTAFYEGTIPRSAVRLTRIGAPPEQAARIDWDGIGEGSVALRGFGNVLWYPVSSPALFLGDGARLFQAVGQSRLQQERSTLAVRLAIEYEGEPPVSVFLNGQWQAAEHVSEEPDAPVAESRGVATASFRAAPLGFRTPSLFVCWQEPKPAGGAEVAPLLTTIAERPEAATPYADAAKNLAPLLQSWLGPAPLTPLTVIDHPGQSFEDGALLVTPMTVTDAKRIEPTLVHSLTHAWFRSSLPWLNEGVAQFMAVVQDEGSEGRDRALAGLRGLIVPLTLMEPEPTDASGKPQPTIAEQSPAPTNPQTGLPFDPRNLPGPPLSYSPDGTPDSTSTGAGNTGVVQPSNSRGNHDASGSDPKDSAWSSSSSSRAADSSSLSSDAGSSKNATAARRVDEAPQPLAATLPPPAGEAGQSLIGAHDEVYYRAKAAAVLVMLRAMVGDDAMQDALKQYREYARHATAEHPEDPREFQRVLEEAAGRELGWVFDDWVYNDRGLADLTIMSVTPRSLTTKIKDRSWLVAVEIRNQGSVNVEVPVTVRSGNLTTTQRVRLAPQSTTSVRILFEGTPQEVLLNDGTVPETAAPLHTYQVRVPLTSSEP